MVKTRHSLEVEDSPQQFVSLRRISTRRSRNFGVDRFSSGESDAEFVEGMATRRGRSAGKCTKRRRIACIEDESADDEHPSLHMRPNSRKVGRTTMNGDSFGLIRRSTRQKKSLYDTLNQKLIIDNAALGLVDVKGDMPAPASTQTRSQRRQAAEQDDRAFGEEGFSDMYSRVKRGRQAMKKDMYGIPIPDQGEETEASELDGEGEGDNSGEEEEDDNKEEDESENDDESDELPPRRSYFLREHKPRTQIYEAPPIGPQLRRSGKAPAIFQVAPRPIQRKQPRDHQMYRSPARRNSIRRKAAFHGSSSTSSSDSSSSDDENRFQRRKAKSMAKARNRCLPMNLDADDVTGFRKDRSRIGSSLADVDPMAVDKSVNFESVGGLGKHVRALKEMVVFPLLYPEVFQKFKISPPRGVLFYGPPGTGKTLVARALANECSNEDRRVAFFMRKGADCLSKWVGESERQLRLLFDQAYQMRPSIIFFDEIDGLAPVRSSRQDQIHSSIVSTLLALMDGLDSRGEIVVIGATNRIDSIDPALRRPGRFDREFLFPLPSVQARQQILKIHTNAWSPKLLDPFLGELAERCVGYCGADLKALCTEAALLALRRRYPQIYNSSEKLQLDVSSINVSVKDFTGAMQVIVPTAQRSVGAPSRALSVTVAPLLRALLNQVLTLLQSVFPSHLAQAAGVDTSAETGTGSAETSKLGVEDFCSDDDENAPCIFEQSASKQKKNNSVQRGFFSFGMSSGCALTHRPRLMLAGGAGQGHTAHLAPAVLHHLERLPVHILDLPALFACSAKSPEESCAQVFREARRTAPSVVYMPHVDQWWPVLNDTLQATLLMLVEDLDPSAPILLLATADTAYLNLHHTVQDLFDNRFGEVVSMRNPSDEERREYFADLLQNQATKPPPRKRQAALRALEVLPKAVPPKPRELTQAEKKKMEEQEEATNRELRLFLRDALNKIARDRKFNIFAKPVDIEEVPDYYEIVKNPMDLSTMMSKIDLRQYESVKEFLADINLICNNALEYNPDKDPCDRAIRHRACALRDTAQSIMKNELDSDFENLCEEMVESRKRRGAERPKVTPDFYFTKPLQKPQNPGGDNPPSPSRFSKRARGLQAEDYSEFIADKRVRFPRKPMTGDKDDVESSQELTVIPSEDKDLAEPSEELPKAVETPHRVRPHTQSTGKSFSSGKKIYRKKDVWNYTSRRRKRASHLAHMHRSQQRAKAQVEMKGGETTEEDDAEVSFSKPRTDVAPELATEVVESDVSQETITDITADVQVTPAHEKSSLSPTVAKISPKTSPKITSPSGKTSKKTSPSARTELDFSELKLLNSEATNSGVIDSGLGSSMESNGESMDSVDQLKQQQGQTPDASGTKASSETNDPASSDPPDSHIICQAASSTETTYTPSFRMTRSRSGNKDAQLAVSILEEPEQPLVVDRPRLDRLLAEVVDRTRDYTVEQLCKLYSMLSRCVFQHRAEFNKTQLIQDLEWALEKYTSQSHRPTVTSSTVHSH